MRFVLIWLAGLLLASPARAHEMPKSAVFLDFRSQGVEAELRLPIGRLQVALRHDGTGEDAPDAAAMLGPARARVAAYVLGHVQAGTPAGAPWSVRLLDIGEETPDQGEALVARLALTPPAGAPAHRRTWSGCTTT